MKCRKLGNSDLNISCVGLGGNIFGHFTNQNETTAIIRSAEELGINFIDTADVYSNGVSEELIGKSVRHVRRNWIIASKAGVRGDEYRDKKHVGRLGQKREILHRVEQSLKRLGTDYLDVYQMHHYDPGTPLEETMEALYLMVQQGKIRSAGVSNYSTDQLRRSLQISQRHHWPMITATQNHYNLFKRSIENEIFPVCHEFKGQIGILVYGCLARGVLGGHYGSAKPIALQSRASESASIRSDLTETTLKAVEDLSAFSRDRGRTIGELAIAWVLKKKEVASVIVGVRNSDQLKENAKAVDFDLTDADLVEIDKRIGSLEKFQSVSLGVSH